MILTSSIIIFSFRELAAINTIAQNKQEAIPVWSALQQLISNEQHNRNSLAMTVNNFVAFVSNLKLYCVYRWLQRGSKTSSRALRSRFSRAKGSQSSLRREILLQLKKSLLVEFSSLARSRGRQSSFYYLTNASKGNWPQLYFQNTLDEKSIAPSTLQNNVYDRQLLYF